MTRQELRLLRNGSVAIVLVPLTVIAQVDKKLSLGSAARFLIQYPYREGCDLPGRVEARFQPGNATDFVEPRAWVWQSNAPDAACGPIRLAEQVIVIDGALLGNPRIVLRDGAPGGTVELMAKVALLDPGRCSPAQDGVPDSGCNCSAQCGYGGVCRVGVDLAYCAIPCTQTAQCPGGMSCVETACIRPRR